MTRSTLFNDNLEGNDRMEMINISDILVFARLQSLFSDFCQNVPAFICAK